MIVNFDAFGIAETPTFIVCNPDKSELYAMGSAFDKKYSPRYNALSEISFTAPSKIFVNPITKNVEGFQASAFQNTAFQVEDVDTSLVEYYDYLAPKRLVLLPDIGYFMITEVEEINDGITNLKTVVAKSLEVQLTFKKISNFSGTYQFYNSVSPSGTLLATILTYIPGWTIGIIDAELQTLWRTFDISDSTIYSFLINDVEEAFQAVFDFDYNLQTINAYTVEGATSSTDIFMSFDNLLEEVNISEISDELVTALNVYGSGDLSINQVNPLGGDSIYDFSYFKSTSWMPQELLTDIENWEIVVESYQAGYADLLTELLDYNETLISQQADLVDLQGELAALEAVKSAKIQQGLSLTTINISIAAKEAEITAQSELITTTSGSITTTGSSLAAINTLCSFDNNFSGSQLTELSNFIYGSTYQNDNFIQTDLMTNAEIQAEAQELYDQALDVLAKVSQPRYEFKVDAVNFTMLSEFQTFITQLSLGAIITLELNTGTYIYPVLLGMDINYEDPSDFSLIFSNRLRLDDSSFQFSDLFEQTVSSSLNTSFNSEQWGSWNTNYKDDVSTFIDSALDTATNNVVSGSSQNVIWDSNGIRIRQMLDSGTYDPKQIWMNNGIIAFTKDNWDSSSLALGQISTVTGSAYGLVAEIVVGTLLAGNDLLITNENNTFEVDGSGATLTDAILTLTTTGGNTKILLDPTNGIKIQKKSGASWSDQFYVDSSGNVIFKGGLSGATGTFSGALVAATGTFSGELVAATGTFSGNISGASGTFTGNIYANKLYGLVDYSQLTNIPPSMILPGTMNSVNMNGLGGTITISKTGSLEIQAGGGFFGDGATGQRGLVFGPGLTSLVNETRVKISTPLFTWGNDIVATRTWVESYGGVGTSGVWVLSDHPSGEVSGIEIENSTSCYSFGLIYKMDSGGGLVLASNTSIAGASGFVLSALNNKWLVQGLATFDSWNWSAGGLIYLGTGGNMTQSVPSGTDVVAQILGVAINSTRMFFNPSLVQVEML